MGNCGLTLAPLKDGDEDAIVKSFVRVEAIPRHALEKGIKWRWHSFGEYLGALEGNVGVNVGCLVGHIAVRQDVMGEDSVAREATGENGKAIYLDGKLTGDLPGRVLRGAAQQSSASERSSKP